ncbi:hypothetical protein NGM37_44420, partial [Streptomyces sp. TRM76130]|nr:hypothetical protein [Streptomyces sp. TRM76130]
QRLWEQALADPAVDRTEARAGASDGRAAEAAEVPEVAGVCPYRGLAAYRQQDARWFFGRERSRDDLIALVRSAERTGGMVALVGASGAGKSSLLNAGLMPAFQAGGAGDGNGPAGARRVLYLVPGATPLTELTRRIPPLAEVVPAPAGSAAAPGP